MARAARSRHVWTPLLPAISDRNRNKSKISEFVTRASQNSEANDVPSPVVAFFVATLSTAFLAEILVFVVLGLI